MTISRLIVPGLGSDRVYIVDVKTDPLNPKLDKVIEPSTYDTLPGGWKCDDLRIGVWT